MASVIVITSGKGGVGKTVASSSIALGMALRGIKTVVVDLDVGLRNLDLALGCERRVVFDLINVMQGEARLEDALIRDRHSDNLFILPASQTRDKDALSKNGLGKLIDSLVAEGFEYIVLDSPPGLERGARLALYFADEVIFVVNPTRASLRDCDRMVGLLQQESKKLSQDHGSVVEWLLINRFDESRVASGSAISRQSIVEQLGIDVLGIVPESDAIALASEKGTPVISDRTGSTGAAFDVVVSRLLGENLPADTDSDRESVGRPGLLGKLLNR